jgi:ribosomal protein S1
VDNTPNLDDEQMEPLPDFGTLSDDDLKSLIEELEREENEVSYRRRILQGRIDILRAERTARLKGGGVSEVDVDRLTDILASRRTPEDATPGEDET